MINKVKRIINLFKLAFSLENCISTKELSKMDKVKLSTYDKELEKRILDISIYELGKRLVIDGSLSPEFVR